MSRSATDSSAIPFLRTTFFRATFIVAICILAVVMTSELIALKKIRQSINSWTDIRATEATAGIAIHIAGGLKFGRAEPVHEIIDSFANGVPDDLLGVAAYQASGEDLSMLTRPGFNADLTRQLAKAAIETGKPQKDEAALIWAFPSRFGGDQAIVGALVTQWSVKARVAAAMADRVAAITVSGVVFIIALLSAATMFYRSISRPLRHVADQMVSVAQGEYDQAIDGTQRRDEIGGIAKRLDKFRAGLQAAKTAQTENAFKSAAIASTGAALMLLDAEMTISFVNPACTGLLQLSEGKIRSAWPDFKIDRLIGAPAKRLPGLDGFCDRIRSGHLKLPDTVELKWGDARINVSADTVVDETGRVIGFVMEIKDVSLEKLNAAVMSAIDAHQIRIDFGSDQRLVGANRRFRDLTGVAEADLRGKFGPQCLARLESNDDERRKAMEQLKGGVAVSGKFKLTGNAVKELYFEGSLSPILSREGVMERVVFIGSDITDSHKAMQAADEDRRDTAQQQQLVVDTLKVGLRKMAQGDLTSSISEPFRPEYEQLRTYFNQAVDSLHGAMCAVVQNAESIRGETGEISNAADDLARRTEKQAGTLEETAAALDELTASVKSAAAGADEASKIAAGAQSKAETGGNVARQAVEAMDAIKASSQEISKITGVIDDIAFQTNLLALNAGVEAARAGDAGRGFAVVATEVRALAQRSSEAAREINQLISASGNHVKSGVDLVDRTGEALGDIVTSVVDISTRVSAIAASAREQSMGLNEINSAMNDLDQVTQQNAAMFEETTAASHALTSEANSLVEAAAKFKVNMPRIGKASPGSSNAPRSETGAAWPVDQRSSKPRRAAKAASGGATAEAPRDVSWEEF